MVKKKQKNVSRYKIINEIEKELLKKYNKFLNDFIILEFIKLIKKKK